MTELPAEARCETHPDEPVAGACTRCGRFVCAKCGPRCAHCQVPGAGPLTTSMVLRDGLRLALATLPRLLPFLVAASLARIGLDAVLTPRLGAMHGPLVGDDLQKELVSTADSLVAIAWRIPVTSFLLVAVQIVHMRDVLVGARRPILATWRASLAPFATLVLASSISDASQTVGTLFCLAPGLILLVVFSAAEQGVLLGELGAVEALFESARLAQRFPWPLVLSGVAPGIVLGAIELGWKAAQQRLALPSFEIPMQVLGAALGQFAQAVATVVFVRARAAEGKTS